MRFYPFLSVYRMCCVYILIFVSMCSIAQYYSTCLYLFDFLALPVFVRVASLLILWTISIIEKEVHIIVM